MTAPTAVLSHTYASSQSARRGVISAGNGGRGAAPPLPNIFGEDDAAPGFACPHDHMYLGRGPKPPSCHYLPKYPPAERCGDAQSPAAASGRLSKSVPCAPFWAGFREVAPFRGVQVNRKFFRIFHGDRPAVLAAPYRSPCRMRGCGATHFVEAHPVLGSDGPQIPQRASGPHHFRPCARRRSFPNGSVSCAASGACLRGGGPAKARQTT